MSVLGKIFRRSKNELWRQLAEDIGGQYEDGGYWNPDGVRYKHEEWEIVLDTYEVSAGNSSQTITRMRAPFINLDGFYFYMYNEHVFTRLAKFFGAQDVEIGDEMFDKKFMIKANDPVKLKALLDDKRLKQLIYKNPKVRFGISDGSSPTSRKFPGRIECLFFEVHGTIRNKRQLKDWFEMFSIALERLVEIDSAYENDPLIRIRL